MGFGSLNSERTTFLLSPTAPCKTVLTFTFASPSPQPRLLHTTWPLPSPEGERYLPPRGEEKKKRKKVPEPEEPRYLCAPGCQPSADVRHLSCSSSPCVPIPAGQRLQARDFPNKGETSVNRARRRRLSRQGARAAGGGGRRAGAQWESSAGVGAAAAAGTAADLAWLEEKLLRPTDRLPAAAAPNCLTPGWQERQGVTSRWDGRGGLPSPPHPCPPHSTAQSAERAGNASSRWGRRPGAPGLPLPGSESGRERKARLISCYSARGLILLGSSQRSGASGENKGLLWGMSRALSQLVKVAF